jgi:hypothetical protein
MPYGFVALYTYPHPFCVIQPAYLCLYFQLNFQYSLLGSSLSYLRGTRTCPIPPGAGFTDPASLRILSIISVLKTISKNLNGFYQSKDGKEEKIFDALEWIAAMCSHPPALPEITSYWTSI